MNMQQTTEGEVRAALGRYRSRRPLFMALALLMTLFETQCVVTDDVSKFASQSSDALAQGQSVLDDIYGSCVRDYMASRDLASSLNQNMQFDTQEDETANIAQECKGFADDRKGVEALSNVLKLYFTTVSQLASARAATDAAKKNAGDSQGQSNLAKGSTLANSANHTIVKGVQSSLAIATLLSKLLTGAYQQRKLAQTLEDADAEVGRLIDALTEIIETQYLGTKVGAAQLRNEQTDLQQHIETYLNYLKNNKDRQIAELAPSIEYLYRDQWDQHIQVIAAKRSAAQAYLGALAQIKDGHSKLTAQAKAGGLNAKQTVGLLQPYLQAIAEEIPKIKTPI